MELDLAAATAQDLPALALADARAFGVDAADPGFTAELALVDPARFLLARDGSRIAGVTGDFRFQLTVPGGATVPIPGVSWVSVGATYRRRGVLRALMTAQHERFVAEGVMMAALTASEAAIYGRFGYGPATVNRAVAIDRTRAVFRPGAIDPGGVWEADATEARPHAAGVHDRWRRQVPGALSRTDQRWDVLMAAHPSPADGARFFLLHAEGYAAYRVDRTNGGRAGCRVIDLVATTDTAHAALWRVLLGLDLVDTVTDPRCPPDDPLPFLLSDPRLVRTTAATDGMWLRLVDVAAALAARTYTVELDVVLEVADRFLGRGGRFRLRAGPDGASCEPTHRAAQAHADVASLAALYLGGHRAITLARAGLLEVPDPAVARRLDLAFSTDRAPQHGTHF
jgi:predicted acetyltransferase